jgi:hypothetical protein
MSASERAELVTLIDRFLSGEDQSLALANEIEGQLRGVLASFSDTEWFDEAELALALYRPGGGDHLLDADAVVPVLRTVRAQIS